MKTQAVLTAIIVGLFGVLFTLPSLALEDPDPFVILCVEDGQDDHCAYDAIYNVDLEALSAYGPSKGDWTEGSFWMYCAGVMGVDGANGYEIVAEFPIAGGYWSHEVSMQVVPPNIWPQLIFSLPDREKDPIPEYQGWEAFGQFWEGTFIMSWDTGSALYSVKRHWEFVIVRKSLAVAYKAALDSVDTIPGGEYFPNGWK